MQISGLVCLFPKFRKHKGVVLYFGITGLAAVINVFLILPKTPLSIVAGFAGIGIMILSASILLEKGD